MLDQHLQHIKGTAAQAQRSIALQHQALTEVESVGSELQHRFVADISEAVHGQSLAGHLIWHVSPSRLRTFLAMSYLVSWQPSVTVQPPRGERHGHCGAHNGHAR
ncbi:hypothetical protein D3C80_1863590 [compost metagenome]